MSNNRRFWEIDALRGFALLHMAIFHSMFDLRYFGVDDRFGLKQMSDRFFDHYSTAIAASFLTLVGVSARVRSQGTATQRLRLSFFLQPLRRVAASAFIVSVASVLAHTSLPIYFGVLHLIAFSLLLMPFTLRAPRFSAVLGVAFVVVGFSEPQLHGIVYEWTGLAHNPVRMGDYFPIFPWLGFVWVGAGIADFILKSPHSWRWPESWGKQLWARALSTGGRHTLIIYLVHQPILVGLFWVLGWVRW